MAAWQNAPSTLIPIGALYARAVCRDNVRDGKMQVIDLLRSRGAAVRSCRCLPARQLSEQLGGPPIRFCLLLASYPSGGLHANDRERV